jgi:hypothetical protein
MRCYGDDRDHSSLRAVIPEDPISSGCFLLDIRFEDLFPVRPLERSKFVRLQRRMAEVGFKKPQAFPNGFKDIRLGAIVFNLPKVGVRLRGENELVHRLLFGVPRKRSAINGSLLGKPGQNFLKGVLIFEKPSLLDRDLHHGFEHNSISFRICPNGTDVAGWKKFGKRNPFL